MKSFILTAAALLFACSADEPRQVAQSSANPPKWMREEPKKVEASPAVKALVASEDPDLNKKLTEAEVRAALAAAQRDAPAPPPAAPSLNVPSSGEWEKLTQEQKRRDDAHKLLLRTTVYGAIDSQYHNRGCERLFRLVVDEGGLARPQYVGFQLTLGSAVERGLTRHSGCGAPSAEYRYQ